MKHISRVSTINPAITQWLEQVQYINIQQINVYIKKTKYLINDSYVDNI